MRDLIAQDVARRYLEKRAISPALLGTAIQTPGIAEDAMNRYHNTLSQLEAANKLPLGAPLHLAKNAAIDWSGKSMGVNVPTGGGGGGGSFGDKAQNALFGIGAKMVGTGASEGIKRLFAPTPGFMERKDVPAVLGQQAIQSIGKGVSDAGVSLLKDMASKAMSAIAHAGDNAARQAILQQLRMEDPVLAEADDKLLMESYHTMVRFAPTLSTDKNAVRTFLREAVMTGVGPNFATIKMLGETERTITGQGKGN